MNIHIHYQFYINDKWFEDIRGEIPLVVMMKPVNDAYMKMFIILVVTHCEIMAIHLQLETPNSSIETKHLSEFYINAQNWRKKSAESQPTLPYCFNQLEASVK